MLMKAFKPINLKGDLPLLREAAFGTQEEGVLVGQGHQTS